MPETVEKVLHDFLQLDEQDRHWVLEQLATGQDGEPIDMYVSASMVLDADQFDEARKRLKELGYVPLAKP
jgi:hypothetical protein